MKLLLFMVFTCSQLVLADRHDDISNAYARRYSKAQSEQYLAEKRQSSLEWFNKFMSAKTGLGVVKIHSNHPYPIMLNKIKMTMSNGSTCVLNKPVFCKEGAPKISCIQGGQVFYFEPQQCVQPD